MRLDSILPVGCFEFRIPELCLKHQKERRMKIANISKMHRREPDNVCKPMPFLTWQRESDKVRIFIHWNSYYAMHAEGLPCGCIIYHYEGQWKERGQ